MPGDKSISHRALMLGGLGHGVTHIRGLNGGADVKATIRVLGQLGVPLDTSKDEVEVQGCGGEVEEPADVLDCANSGTTLRLLAGICASVPGAYVLTGDESLRRRPMLRIAAPLRQMGATVDGPDHGNRPPLFIRGGELTGIDHSTHVPSAQVKSALLLAGLRASGSTAITEPALSRDHTERMLSATGVEVARHGTTVGVTGGGRIDAFDLTIPGDFSAAAFLIAAAALLPGSDLTISGVGLNPTRTAFLDVLADMNADVEAAPEGDELGEPIGSIATRAGPLQATDVTPDAIPRLIDEIPILAVVATQAEGTTVIKGAGELRAKESDRIEALRSQLAALGARIEAFEDGLAITGPTPLGGGVVDSFEDHRIAMALAVAGMLTSEKVTVRGWSCVDTSFPGFLETVGAVRQR